VTVADHRSLGRIAGYKSAISGSAGCRDVSDRGG